MMWVWKESEDEAHNVIHVKSPDSDVSLSPRGWVRGGSSTRQSTIYRSPRVSFECEKAVRMKRTMLYMSSHLTVMLVCLLGSRGWGREIGNPAVYYIQKSQSVM